MNTSEFLLDIERAGQVARPNKTARLFFELSERALSPDNRGSLVAQSSYEEQIAFHRMNKDIMGRASRTLRYKLEESYPFIKIRGTWFVSIPRLFTYLLRAREVLAQYKDLHIRAVYAVVQLAQSYIDEYRALSDALTPLYYENHDEYQKKMSGLYEQHLMEQQTIFDALNEKTPDAVTRG